MYPTLGLAFWLETAKHLTNNKAVDGYARLLVKAHRTIANEIDPTGYRRDRRRAETCLVRETGEPFVRWR